jgi:phosphatidylserine/phosphatidylglycerophosphate/cardiolipin synthase-like enzyme
VQHAKFFIVDGQEIFLGSQNFDWRALKHIHELGVRVRDARLARALGQVFEMDWAAARDSAAADSAARAPVAQRRVAAPIRIVQAPGDTAELWPSFSPKRFIPDTLLWDRDAIVRRLDGARHEVVLQLLTYSPTARSETDSTLDAALRRAAARGVKVKLLVSDWVTNGPGIESLQRLARVPNIEARLSTVAEWSGGYIPYARVEHCKYAVVDSLWAWVGTSNWEPGYFHGSRNVAVTLRNRALALQARQVFETSWDAPGAAPVRPDARYEAKVHGSTPPEGRKKYGE